jgi:ankyrin repeat protein
LALAAAYGHLEACKLLLPKSDVLVKDNCRLTAYGNAFVTRRSTKDEVLRKRVNDIVEFLKIPTFVAACAAGDLALVKRMIEEHKVDINGLYEERSGLHAACVTLTHEVIEYLLTLPALNVNVRNARGRTPLYTLCMPIDGKILDKPTCTKGDEQARRIAVADLLIKAGADVNIQTTDELNEAPIHVAISHHQLDLVKFLILMGADLNVKRRIPEKLARKYSIPEKDLPTDILSSVTLISKETRKQIPEHVIRKYVPNAPAHLTEENFDILSTLLVSSVAGVNEITIGDSSVVQELIHDLPPDVVACAKSYAEVYFFLKDYIEGRFKFKLYETLGETLVMNPNHDMWARFNLRCPVPSEPKPIVEHDSTNSLIA